MNPTLLYFLKNNPKPDYIVGKILIGTYLGFILAILLRLMATIWWIHPFPILFTYWERVDWNGFYRLLIYLWVSCSIVLPVMSFWYKREAEWKWLTYMVSVITLIFIVSPILVLTWFFSLD